MSPSELHRLLHDSDQATPDSRLSQLGDYLVTTKIVSADAFWDIPLTEQLLYAMCCVLHHAGANGFEAVWNYNEPDSAATTAAAIEALERVGAGSLLAAATNYWNILTDSPRRCGMSVPVRFSCGSRHEYEVLQDRIYDDDPTVFEARDAELSEHASQFVSCWNTDFPVLCLAWLRLHEAELCSSLCHSEVPPSTSPTYPRQDTTPSRQ